MKKEDQASKGISLELKNKMGWTMSSETATHYAKAVTEIGACVNDNSNILPRSKYRECTNCESHVFFKDWAESSAMANQYPKYAITLKIKDFKKSCNSLKIEG